MAVVSGQVRDLAGQGVPGVLVTAVPVGGRRFSAYPTTHTDLSGRWALDLPDGAWKVRETGFGGHEFTVAGAPFTIGEQVQPETQVALEPSYEDIERLLARRQAASHEVEQEPAPKLAIDIGDMTAFLRERRGE